MSGRVQLFGLAGYDGFLIRPYDAAWNEVADNMIHLCIDDDGECILTIGDAAEHSQSEQSETEGTAREYVLTVELLEALAGRFERLAQIMRGEDAPLFEESA